MNCRTHPTKSGLNTCSQCGDWLCEECTIEVGGRIFCKSCLQQTIDRTAGKTKECTTTRPYAHHINWGVLFMFSFVPPGINYMYEGLIKRGLFTLSSFFLCCYLTSIFNQPLFGLVIPIMWITSVFDSFQIRRRINAGEIVHDSVDDVVGFVQRNKSMMILFTVVLLGLGLISSAGHAFSFMFYPIKRFVSPLLPIVILGMGMYLFMRSGRKRGGHGHDHRRDHDNEE